MVLSEIPIWQWVATIWLSTWTLAIWRTWSRIQERMEVQLPKHSMTKRPFLHFLVYTTCFNMILILAGIPLVVSDKKRDMWVYAYVKSLGKEKT
jgi:hypothetical protein